MQTQTRKHRILVGALLAAALMASITTLIGCVPLPPPTPTPTPTAIFTPTPEPLVPTRLPTATLTTTATPAGIAPAGATLQATATLTQSAPPEPATTPTVTPSPTVSVEPSATLVAVVDSLGPVPENGRKRVGVGLPIGDITDYDWGDGLPGWYLAWQIKQTPSLPGDIRFVQMIYLFGDDYQPDLPKILTAVRNNPGSLWLIGNEPDVAWQGNATPEQYAATYGELYPAIKQADPTAQVAIGGVSQPTPLRMEYLDRILAAYETQFGEPMPIDVWNVHAFILREERDSWGVGIPPGMDVDQGTLYEIEEHTDIAIFRRQIEDFRRWMAERGFRDKPLLVSEYGVLMPDSYGFPPDAVSEFMVSTFDYFLTARDDQTGYPEDENRLVQAFCWYSVSDTRYPTSNLFDPESYEITALGEVFKAYVAGLQ